MTQTQQTEPVTANDLEMRDVLMKENTILSEVADDVTYSAVLCDQ